MVAHCFVFTKLLFLSCLEAELSFRGKLAWHHIFFVVLTFLITAYNCSYGIEADFAARGTLLLEAE